MITDEMLALACNEWTQSLLDTLPPAESCTHAFSSRFHRKMQRLIWKDRHRTAAWMIQKAACVALVVLLGFGTLFALSPTVRAEIIHWVRETFGIFTQYSYQGSEQQQEHTEYDLTNVPEGFVQLHRTQFRNRTEIQYHNSATNQYIQFVYCRSKDALALYLDSREYQITPVDIPGCQAEYYHAADTAASDGLFIYDARRNVFFWLSGPLDREELTGLYKKIEILEN